MQGNKDIAINTEDFRQAIICLANLCRLIEKNPVGFRKAFSTLFCNIPKSNFRKFQWTKGGIPALEAFYFALKKHELIDNDFSCSREQFQDIFLGDNIPEKVVWEGAINELVFLFLCLYDEGIIIKPVQPNKMLKNCFLDKGRKLLNNRVLASSGDNGLNNKERKGIIEKIIEQVKKEIIKIDGIDKL